MMTQKDYELIESVIADTLDRQTNWNMPSAESLAIALADAFQKNNPKFKRGLFVLNSGIKRFM